MISQSVTINPPNSYNQIIKLIANKEKTFLFIHNKNKYYANPIVTCYHSRKINFILMSDPLFNEYMVPNYSGDFQLVIDFLQNSPIEINEGNALFLINVGCDLQIDNLVSRCLPYIPIETFLTNKNNILQNLYFSGSNIEKVLLILSSHFTVLLSTDFLIKLPIPFIDAILHSPLLNVDSKDLLNFLSKIFNWKKNPNHRLAKYLPLEIIPKDDIKCYLNDYRLNFNHQRINIFNSFQITDKKIHISGYSVVKADLPPPILSDDIYPGIIRKIYTKSQLNNNNSSILLSSSSVAFPTDMQESYGPEVLLNEGNVQYFCTKQGENEWLEIGFENYKVSVSGYMLMSWRGASNKVCPVSWNLEASNDCKQWFIIDSKENILDLMIDSGCYVASIDQSKWYKYFRFTQLKTGNEGNTALALAGFEIYGLARLSS